MKFPLLVLGLLVSSPLLWADTTALISPPEVMSAANAEVSVVQGVPAVQMEQAAVKLQQLLADVRGFQADFRQTTLDNSGQMLQDIEGQLTVQRPGLFRWQAKPPLAQLVVSDGNQLWQYDEDLEQVVVQQVDERMSQTPALILSGDTESLLAAYQVTGMEQGTGLLFTLTPNQADAMFDSLRLSFVDGKLQEMYLLDSLGQRVSIQFSEVNVNPELGADLFTFIPPAGVDVLQQ